MSFTLPRTPIPPGGAVPSGFTVQTSPDISGTLGPPRCRGKERVDPAVLQLELGCWPSTRRIVLEEVGRGKGRRKRKRKEGSREGRGKAGGKEGKELGSFKAPSYGRKSKLARSVTAPARSRRTQRPLG